MNEINYLDLIFSALTISSATWIIFKPEKRKRK